MGNGSLAIYTEVNWPCSWRRFFLASPRLGLAVDVRPRQTCSYLTYFPVAFFSFFIFCVMSSRRGAGFQFLMDFTVTEVNGHRAENDSCPTCVSISTERFCWDELKLPAKFAARALIKIQPSSPSTPRSLSLPAINLNNPAWSSTYRDCCVAVGVKVQRTQVILSQQRSWLIFYSRFYSDVKMIWAPSLSQLNVLWSVSTQIQLLQSVTLRLISDTSAFVINQS